MRNVVVAGLLVLGILAGAGAGYFISTSTQGTSTSTLTSHLYQVEFIQESNCPYGSWLVPWGVSIDHQTTAQPPNATLPLSYGATHLTGNSTYSTISFSLPNGAYNYSILPNDPLGTEQSGNVTVDGGKAVVQVYAFVTSMGCSSTTTEAQTTTTVTCVQTLSAPLYLIVKNDNGAPIPDQPLTIQAHLLVGFVYNSTTGRCDSILSTHRWMNETGSDGKIELGWTGDVFNITTTYLGRTYQVNADAEGAESAECVTLSLPSGGVNTTFAGQFKYQC